MTSNHRSLDERETFEEIYRQHHRRLVTFAAHMLGDAQSAEDIAHDALMQYVKHTAHVQDARKWLTTVAYRRTLNELRRRRREADAYRREAAQLPSPELGHLIDPIDQDLALALRRLSDRQRAAVLLCWGEGNTARQAAAVLGCSAASVRVHLHRARRSLLDALGDDNRGGDER